MAVVAKHLVGPRGAAAVALFVALALTAERQLGTGSHPVIALAAWALLIAMLVPRSDHWRARTLVVVVAATAGEILASQVLQIYTYAHGAVPAFVPPGHGIVFLAGCGLAQARWAQVRRDHLVAGAVAIALVWALVGLSRAQAPDLSGALGVAVLVALIFVAAERRRLEYAGVFVAVSLLELLGTTLGTWHWSATAPLLGLPAGNPPSGVAGGYLLFALAGFATAPGLLATFARLAGRTTTPVAGSA